MPKAGIPGYWDVRVQGYRDTGIHWNTGTLKNRIRRPGAWGLLQTFAGHIFCRLAACRVSSHWLTLPSLHSSTVGREMSGYARILQDTAGYAWTCRSTHTDHKTVTEPHLITSEIFRISRDKLLSFFFPVFHWEKFVLKERITTYRANSLQGMQYICS